MPTFSEIDKRWLKRTCILSSLLISCFIFVLATAFSFNSNFVNKATPLLIKTSEQQIKPLFPTYSQSKKLSFNQMFSENFVFQNYYEYSWTKNGSFFLFEKNSFSKDEKATQKIYLGNYHSEETNIRVDQINHMSSDNIYEFHTENLKKVHRHSTESLYYIVKTAENSSSRRKWAVGPNKNASIQAFYWNPEKNSHDFVYVHNYNIFYQQDPEHPDRAIMLTSNGSFFERFGVTNWLYEEEILETGAALWWSPSGQYVSYLKFDDREVNRVFLPHLDPTEIYIRYTEIPYPKAGVLKNTIVSQYIWKKANQEVLEIASPRELDTLNGNYYIFQNVWIKMPTYLPELGSERLVIVWSNRVQNQVFFSLCNESDCVVSYSLKFQIGKHKLWAEPKEVGCIHETNFGFFTILPHNDGKGNIYNHIAHISLKASGVGTITKWIGFEFDVLHILGYNTENDVLLFTGYGSGIGAKSAYKVSHALDIKNNSVENVNKQLGCENSEKFSLAPTGKTLMLQCQEPFKETKMYLTNVDNITEYFLLPVQKHQFLPFEKPKLEYGSVKLASGIDSHYMLMTPPNIPAGKKIPLLVDIYGGPNSKKVIKKTPPIQTIQICSEFDVAIANVDVRGTSGRGWKIKEPVYKKLGQSETDDILDFIRTILGKKRFIDVDNIAVMGWSYGGFLATKLAIKDQGDLVKCAIAISPVSDFRLYDSAFTERFLGFPSENPEGYAETNLIPHANNMSNIKYFLAHGEQDDNVHYQNSAKWSEALQFHNVHFKQLVYPNEGHSLNGKTKHLFFEIENFLTNECFKI